MACPIRSPQDEKGPNVVPFLRCRHEGFPRLADMEESTDGHAGVECPAVLTGSSSRNRPGSIAAWWFGT